MVPPTRFSQDNTDMHKYQPPTWLNTTSLDMFAAWLSPITHDKCPQPIAGQACQTGCSHPSENWQLLDTTTRAAHRANGSDPPRKTHIDHEATLPFFFFFWLPYTQPQHGEMAGGLARSLSLSLNTTTTTTRPHPQTFTCCFTGLGLSLILLFSLDHHLAPNLRPQPAPPILLCFTPEISSAGAKSALSILMVLVTTHCPS